jgi:Leucine-rich repeat (LRR) protein
MLDLSSNQLSALPESLGRLNALRELYLHDNPHLGLPAEVLGPVLHGVRGKQKTQASPKSILDYYLGVDPPLTLESMSRRGSIVEYDNFVERAEWVKGQETSGIIGSLSSNLNPEGCPNESFPRTHRTCHP